ncbi:phytanoyl-CoA dioxygenase [Paenibacillus sp. 32O-W]|uniref:phytanoyl-CoA dioxygenase family protein n=1 Tax=Paenibacillus sp. 32O-W TaxID=1695218 RepID=UPI000721D47B|nr:phytanoyl-CoA dioxygenase family protein [Paenibacillus sp. 32O-W]ALS29170.1 phytanoyl-CoA dioxygenase [Paenibacillus sp. 32O-W]
MAKVKIGEREWDTGGPYMTELRESNDILNDTIALRERLKEDGYLFIRGFHERGHVLAAREAFIGRLVERGRLAPGTPPEEAVIGPDHKGTSFQGSHDQPQQLLDLVHSPRTFAFFDRLLGGETMTFDYKWVRAVGHGDFTGAHYDIVYMGRGTKNLYTMWTPLGDIPYEMGGLAILAGSGHLNRLRETYGQMDVDKDKVTGWFTTDPLELIETYGGRWATAEYRAGDAVIFGMYTMHGSLTNQTNRFRLSVDTRYQLRSEPVDERWVGSNPKGHYAWTKGKTVTMEEARRQWGV